MNFHMIVEEPSIKSYQNNIERVAIIMANNHILLVQSNRGDFKFPGGGIEKNESYEECIIREVREETGYIHCIVKEKAGIVIERRMDEYNNHALFQMTSHYYICDLATEENNAQQLDEYEAILNFTPKWVSLNEAIKQNESLIERIEQNSWLKRETYVLKQIKMQPDW